MKIKMKHFVLGFVFNKTKTNVLLIEKKRPDWQAGHWNGIGGKVEETDKSPLTAMKREAYEEIGTIVYNFEHCITFICPGGTVFVFKAVCKNKEISFRQIEDEQLLEHPVETLPFKVMGNLKWMIPLCLSTVHKPIILQQDDLGVE